MDGFAYEKGRLMAIELNAGDTLCKEGDIANEMYILVDGALEIFRRDKRGRDKKISEIAAKNSIFGEVGAILKQPRSATIRAKQHTVLQAIDVRKKALDETILSQPRLGLSISFNLARYIKETNDRLSQYTQFLNEIRKLSDEYLLFYYQKSKACGELYDQTHFAWAKTIYDKAKSHMCYGMGEGVAGGKDIMSSGPPPPPPPPTSENAAGIAGGRQFQPGEILCKEGDEGREIFILQTGTLEVQVGGRKVAEIKDKGAVIGEIAVLSGYASRTFEKRTATIMARDAATVIVIDGTKLEAVITANPQLILFVTKVLSERLPGTNNSLLQVDEQIKKYMALLDSTGVTTMTLINAYELLRTNLKSSASDKPQAEGWETEVDSRLNDMKEKARSINDQYAELVKK